MLDERARLLARKPDDAGATGVSMVLFTRGGVTYAIAPGQVEGAGRLKDFTPVPGAPSYIVGAVQFRSRVISLVDLMVLWGLEVRGVADLPLFLVVAAHTDPAAQKVRV